MPSARASHGPSVEYLIWARNDLGKLALLLILTLDDGLNDAGMVGAQVDEAMCDARFPNRFEKRERCRVTRPLSEVHPCAGLRRDIDSHHDAAVHCLSRAYLAASFECIQSSKWIFRPLCILQNQSVED